jgi:hypothetical protein
LAEIAKILHLGWKCYFVGMFCRPRRRKIVGTKPGSVIPGGKSVICILKLKSRTIVYDFFSMSIGNPRWPSLQKQNKVLKYEENEKK